MEGNLIDFYSGFEGEGEVRIYGINVISIWDGYFDSIMEVMLEVENSYKDSAFGIVAEWCTCTGWCDIYGGKRKIHSLCDEIYAFSKFDHKKLDSKEYLNANDEWKKQIINVHKAILKIFLEAQEKNIDVYIEDC